MDGDGLMEGRFYTMGEIERALGIPAATVRAWERRYGVPRPGRSSGRHRLYSEEDLSLLRWLVARQQEGMSISRAVAAWKHQAARATPPADRLAGGPEAAQGLERLRSDWVEACLRYDRALAEAILSQAFALYPAREVCVELLLGGISRIGEGWFRGEATVHQEHFASAIASHQVERLIAATAPWRKERILLACPPGELHAFALLFLALLLRQRGLQTVLLGASVPLERLDSAVAEVRPDLAVLSAQRLPDASALVQMAEVLGRLSVPVGYGGLVFNNEPELRERVAGHFLGEGIPEAVEAAERLLLDRPPAPTPAPNPPELAEAADCYASKVHQIEADVRSAMGPAASPQTLAEANRTIASHLIAAAQMGSFSALHDGRPWLEAAFKAHSEPAQAMRSYLAVYGLAAEVHIRECGGPILAWLRSVRSG